MAGAHRGPRCPRSSRAVADDILRTLEAFGFEWDGGVLFQSGSTARYESALARLRAKGMTYRCRCSRREIADSALQGIEGPVYPGTCRDLAIPGSTPAAVRIRTRHGRDRLRRPPAGPHRAAARHRYRRLRPEAQGWPGRLPARGGRGRCGTRRHGCGARRRPAAIDAAAGLVAAATRPAHAALPSPAGRRSMRPARNSPSRRWRRPWIRPRLSPSCGALSPSSGSRRCGRMPQARRRCSPPPRPIGSPRDCHGGPRKGRRTKAPEWDSLRAW